MLERRLDPTGPVKYAPPAEQVDVPPSRQGTSLPAANILEVLWRRRWIVVSCVLASLIGGMLYLWRAIPIYSSSSQIYIQQGMKNVVVPGLNDNSGTANYLQTQCEVIKSMVVLSAAFDIPAVRNAPSLSSTDNPVGTLKSVVGADIGKQNDVVTVSAESKYPEEAAILANGVVDAYISYENKLNRSNASEVVKILRKEKDEQDVEFRKASKAMLDFKRANGVLSFDTEKGNIILLRLGELYQALTKAQLDALQDRIRAESADALADDPVKLSQFIRAESTPGDPALPAASSSEINATEANLAELKGAFGPNHPTVKALEKRLNALRNQGSYLSTQGAANYIEVAHARAAAAQRRVEELQKTLDEQQKVALDLNSKAAEYAELQAEQHQTESLLEVLNNRIKEFHVNEDSDAPNVVSILEVARPSGGPIRPTRNRTFGLALVIGLMVGVGGAVFGDWVDQRIRSATEVTAMLELQILGVIPHMIGKATYAERGQIIHLQPNSEVAEAYRTIRTGVQFSIDPSCKTIVVTSPSPGDGKTTAASNLAITFAQTGKRVLLIDADCRRPMLHRVFGLAGEVGLSNILTSALDPSAAILKSTRESLDILPCGPVPTNPSEMLNGDPFRKLLNDLTQQYDLIIVDTPPVVMVSDARIVAAACDAVVLVLRAEKTSRRLSVHARDVLRSVGARMVGVVVNDVARGKGEYGYYGGYSYGYYYGYGYGNKNGNGNGQKQLDGVEQITAVSTASDK